jgi:hypothetical protein
MIYEFHDLFLYYVHTTAKRLENGAKKSHLAVAFTLRRSEIVWRRHFCRNNLSTLSKRSEMKTERLAGSCEHKRRYSSRL